MDCHLLKTMDFSMSRWQNPAFCLPAFSLKSPADYRTKLSAWNISPAAIVISKAIIPVGIFQAHELLKSSNGFQRELKTFLEGRSMVVLMQLLAQKVLVNYKLSESKSIWPGMDDFIHPVHCLCVSIHYQWQMKKKCFVLHPDWNNDSHAFHNLRPPSNNPFVSKAS